MAVSAGRPMMVIGRTKKNINMTRRNEVEGGGDHALRNLHRRRYHHLATIGVNIIDLIGDGIVDHDRDHILPIAVVMTVKTAMMQEESITKNHQSEGAKARNEVVNLHQARRKAVIIIKEVKAAIKKIRRKRRKGGLPLKEVLDTKETGLNLCRRLHHLLIAAVGMTMIQMLEDLQLVVKRSRCILTKQLMIW